MEFWKYRRQRAVDTPPVTPTLTAPVITRPIVTGPVAGPPDDRVAFEKGVREGKLAERARHRGHPLLKFAVVLVALAGAAVIALAAHEGSFSKGGAVVDQKLAVAADNAQVSAADAAAKAGQAVKTAGDTIGQKVSDAASKH